MHSPYQPSSSSYLPHPPEHHPSPNWINCHRNGISSQIRQLRFPPTLPPNIPHLENFSQYVNRPEDETCSPFKAKQNRKSYLNFTGWLSIHKCSNKTCFNVCKDRWTPFVTLKKANQRKLDAKMQKCIPLAEWEKMFREILVENWDRWFLFRKRVKIYMNHHLQDSLQCHHHLHPQEKNHHHHLHGHLLRWVRLSLCFSDLCTSPSLAFCIHTFAFSSPSSSSSVSSAPLINLFDPTFTMINWNV